MKILFWNTDTQRDFINKHGKLAVEGAEEIKPTLKLLTDLAKEYDIQVVNTMDYHTEESKELSDTPDFVNTFPEHCMEQTFGVEFIEETKPDHSYVVDYKIGKTSDFAYSVNKVFENRNITILKDAFDVFKGNPLTKQILNIINPELIVVYGVATNVCVNCAVIGLASLGYRVLVVNGAIKELPNLPVSDIFEAWKRAGVNMATYGEIKLFIEILKGKHDN